MLLNYGTGKDCLDNSDELNSSAVELDSPAAIYDTSRLLQLLAVIVLGLVATTLLISNYSVPPKNEAMGTSAQESQILLDIQEPTGYKPNFIVIVADDMSFNSIGYEPYDLAVSTPFLTKLSASGIRNLQYYGQEVCTPSRAALMTGRYPIHTGMQYEDISDTGKHGLNLTETLLPQVLKDNGYSPYALGKWHLGHYSPRYLPTARGFIEYLGYLTGQSFYWSKKATGYNHIHDFMYANEDCYFGYNGTDRHTYSTFLYRDKAIDIINYHNYDDTALFLYLAFQAIHDPYYDTGNYVDGIPPDYFDDDSVYETIHTTVVGRKRRQYAMSLRLLDDAVSKIYSALESKGQLDNTYMIFMSDNGGCSYAGGRNSPLRGEKGSLWDGGVRVDSFIFSPLLPESLQGTNYSGIMHVTDWFPTILDLAGIDYTPKTGYALDGVSQKDAWLHGKSHNKRDYLLYNFYYKINDFSLEEFTNAPLAIRNQQYKLIHAYVDNPSSDWYKYDEASDDDSTLIVTNECEQADAVYGNYSYFLFDLENDPHETTNLYYSSDDDAAQDAMTALYDQISLYKESAVTCYGIQPNHADSEVAWKEHGNTVSPWVKESSLGDVNSYPSYCTYSGVFSPSQKDVDDSNDYDDSLASYDDADDWQDDDADDYNVYYS